MILYRTLDKDNSGKMIQNGSVRNARTKQSDFKNTKHSYVHKYREKDMGVSISGGTPKWMVYREHAIKMDDLGVPLFQEPPIYIYIYIYIHTITQTHTM